MSESSGYIRFCNWKWYSIVLFLGTTNRFKDLGKGSETGGENEYCHGNLEESNQNYKIIYGKEAKIWKSQQW